MKKERISTTIDLVLLTLFMVAAIFICYNLYIGRFVSTFVIGILIVIFFITLILMFVWMFAFKKGEWIRRIVMACMTLSLFLSGLYFNNRYLQTKTSPLKVETSYRMFLMSNEADKKEFQTIGVLLSDRTQLNNFENISESFGIDECNYREFFNLVTLSEALKNEEIDGMIVGQHYRDLLEKSEEDYHIYSESVYRVPVSHTSKPYSSDQPFTILLNVTKDVENIQDARSSSECILLLVDPIYKKITSIELPHNLYVPNVVYDSYPDALSNISYNGIDNVMYSLESVFDMQFDYFIKVSEQAIFECIDLFKDVRLPVEKCEDGECHVAYEKVTPWQAMEHYSMNKNMNELIEALFYSRSELSNTVLMNYLNVFKSTTFTNLLVSNTRSLIVLCNDQEWTFESLNFDHLMTSVEPCISIGGNESEVTIMDYEFLHEVNRVFMEYKHLDVMKNFAFDLDRMRMSMILPYSNEKIILTSNMRAKIDDYFALLPENAILPIEAEKWEGTIRFDRIEFDSSGPILSLD